MVQVQVARRLLATWGTRLGPGLTAPGPGCPQPLSAGSAALAGGGSGAFWTAKWASCS